MIFVKKGGPEIIFFLARGPVSLLPKQCHPINSVFKGQLKDQVAPLTIFILGVKSPLTKAIVLLAPFLDLTNTIQV